MWNTDWTAAQNRCKSIWYANYSSQLDKRSQCPTNSQKFWQTTIVIKDDYSDIQDRAFGMRCVHYNWCANEPCMCALSALITLTSYFCLNTAQYIHVVEFSEFFITDARMCWRSLWGSVVFMCIRASDAPNSLFLQRNYYFIFFY